MKRLITTIIINALAFYLVARYVPGISYQGGLLGLIAITVVFGLINLLVKPIINLLSLPIKVLTLGLFSLVINGGMLYLTSLIIENFYIEGDWFFGIELGPLIIKPCYIPFWATAIIGGLVISIISGFFSWLLE